MGVRVACDDGMARHECHLVASGEIVSMRIRVNKALWVGVEGRGGWAVVGGWGWGGGLDDE